MVRFLQKYSDVCIFVVYDKSTAHTGTAAPMWNTRTEAMGSNDVLLTRGNA